MNPIDFALQPFSSRKKFPVFSPPGNWFQSWQLFLLAEQYTIPGPVPVDVIMMAVIPGGTNIHALLFGQDMPVALHLNERFADAELTDDAGHHSTLPEPTHWTEGQLVSAKTAHTYLSSVKTNYSPGEAFVGTTVTNDVKVTGYLVDWNPIDRKYAGTDGPICYSLMYAWYATAAQIIAGEPIYYDYPTAFNVPVMLAEDAYTQAMYEAGNRCSFMGVENAGYIVGLWQGADVIPGGGPA